MHTFLQNRAAMALLAGVAIASDAKPVLDAAQAEKLVCDAASAHALQDISMQAVSSVQSWVETDDLGDGEGAADRLIAMMVGIADDNKDGELDDSEQEVVQIAVNAAWDYLTGKGVADADIDAMFNSEDGAEANAAGGRVLEFLADRLPDGDEAATDEASDFAFNPEGNDAVFDAVYKKRFAVRGGKKVRIMKRISGHVRLSAAQKVSIRKARMKSHGSKARAHRMKSMRVRKAFNLHTA